MGACSYTQFVAQTDLTSAYSSAVSEAQYEHGSGPYSGSIASSYGVNALTSQVCRLDEAEQLASQLLNWQPVYQPGSYDTDAEATAVRAESLVAALGGPSALRYLPRYGSRATAEDRIPTWIQEKNGDTAAIPVGFDTDLPTTPVGVPVDLVSLGLTEPWPHQQPILDVLRQRVGAGRIASVEVLEDTPKWSVTTKRTSGSAVTRYQIYSEAGNGALTPVGQPMTTLAQAQKLADQLVRQPAAAYGRQYTNLVVHGRTARADGSPLARAQRTLQSRFVVYNVGVVKPATASPAIRGYLLFGTAGC